MSLLPDLESPDKNGDLPPDWPDEDDLELLDDDNTFAEQERLTELRETTSKVWMNKFQLKSTRDQRDRLANLYNVNFIGAIEYNPEVRSSRWAVDQIARGNIAKVLFRNSAQREHYLEAALRTGNELHCIQVTNQVTKFVQSVVGDNPDLQQWQAATIFNKAVHVTAPIHGTTIADFAQGRTDNLPRAQQLATLVAMDEDRILSPDEEMDSLIASAGPPFSDYPDLSRYAYQSMPEHISWLFQVQQYDLRGIEAKNKKLIQRPKQQAAINALKLTENIQRLGDAILVDIFTPQSPQHDEVVDTLKVNLTSNETFPATALKFAGLNRSSQIFDAYRTARVRAIQEGPESEFFTMFADRIHEFVGFLPQGNTIMDYEDVSDIDLSEPDSEVEATSFPWTTLQQRESSIRRLLRAKEFKLSADEITWSNLVPPTILTVNFANRADEVTRVKLQYFDDETAEQINFGWVVNPANQEFDWPLIEHPQFEVQNFRNACLQATESIWTAIDLQLQRPVSRTVQPTPARKGPIADTSLYEIRKQSKSDRSKLTQSHFSPKAPTASTSQTDQRHFKPIRVTDDLKERKRLFASISEADQARVLEITRRTEAFPHILAGKNFKELQSLEAFSYRSGKFRLICESQPTHYEVTRVQYRKDIYRIK